MRELTNPSIRRMLALASLCGGLVLVPARAEAADPSKVGLGTDTLMIGILFEEEAGTYQQDTEVEDGQILARLTFHLPAAPTTAQPGPVVVFWQLRIDVADEQYGDSAQLLVGPPVVEAVLSHCDTAGACDLQVEVGGSTTPALEAADLEWVSESGARLIVAVTLARTYADGYLLQAARPLLGSGGSGGTLAQPMTVTGGLTLSALIPVDAAEAHHAEIPTEEFGIGGSVRLGRRSGRGVGHEHPITIRLSNNHGCSVTVPKPQSGPYDELEHPSCWTVAGARCRRAAVLRRGASKA